jgi:hypothetical protein
VRTLPILAHGSLDGAIEAPQDALATGSTEILQITCPGYAHAWVRHEELQPGRENIIRLSRGATVLVRVVEQTSKLPVPDALVGLLQGELPVHILELWKPSEGAVAAIANTRSFLPGSYMEFAHTDAGGSVVFHSVPPGDYSVSALKYGMWTADPTNIRESPMAVRVSGPRDYHSIEIELAEILLAVAVADLELDIVAVNSWARGINWGLVTMSEAMDADVRRRFPGLLAHHYGLKTTMDPFARASVFAEGFGWITADLTFAPFAKASPTVISAPEGARGAASGDVRVDFLAPDGSPLPLSQCILKGIDVPEVRIRVGSDERVPPGRYMAIPSAAPWLLREIPQEEFEVLPGRSVHRTITANTGAIRVGLQIETFDGDPVPSITVAANRVQSQSRVMRFTTARQRLFILLPWGPVAENYDIVAESFDLRGSAVVTTGGATMPTEPITARIELAPRARRQ